MRFDPYLIFNGDCRQAFDFYHGAIGGTVATMMTYGESPGPNPHGTAMADKILHATLDVGGSELLGYDAPPGRYVAPQGFRITLQVDTPEQAERVFAALSEGGTISTPLGKTFWTQAYGELLDRFGIHWMINCA